MPHPPKGVLGVTPGMIGCAEAAEVLKIIGEYGEVLSGKLWTINVKTMETHLISFLRNRTGPIQKTFNSSIMCQQPRHDDIRRPAPTGT